MKTNKYSFIYSYLHLKFYASLGHYVYIEASSPARQGDNAKLASPVVSNGNGDYCLSFWFHMYGADIGSLNVHIVDSTGDNTVWSRSGDQGNSWFKAVVPLQIASARSQVVILWHFVKKKKKSVE